MRRTDYPRLPKEVYHQCMWIVRDLDRLYRLDAIHRHGKRDDELVFYEEEDCRTFGSEVTGEAARKIVCIRRALTSVPEEYRVDVLDSIVEGVRPPEYAHENTWRKWRRIFIGELAANLNLI